MQHEGWSSRFRSIKVTIWTPDGQNAEKSSVVASVCKLFGEIPQELMTDKVANLQESLKQNPSWPGASAKLGSAGCDLHSVDIPQLKAIVGDQGSAPRMLAQNKWAWRCGAQAWASPGLGVFARADTDSIGFKCLSVENIVSEGISLNDMSGFLETETGVEVLQKSVTVPVKKGNLVWVPYGFVVVPVSAHIVRDKDSEKPPSPEEGVDTAFFVAFNSFVPEWAKQMDKAA